MRHFQAQPAPPLRAAASRSYGKLPGAVHIIAAGALFTMAWASFGAISGREALASPPAAATRPLKIVALGDSLTAGFGLSAPDAFCAKLAKALQKTGIPVDLVNAGVSGDTASDGVARVDWSVPEGTDAVILELGANDALRGIDPKLTRAALGTILERLARRKVAVLLAGMRAPRNLGDQYVQAFDSIFPDLASTFNVVFYPFFLDGVAANRSLNQADGMHPSAAGVDVIVSRILPKVEELIGRARTNHGS